MRKELVKRCLLGAPIGMAISTAITIAISLVAGDGRYYAVVPQLAVDCGSEIGAVTLQAIVSLVYGAAWAGASLIWEKDDWSLTRQTATHLAVCSLSALPIAYLMRWMDHSPAGILRYFAIFFAIYLVIWLCQYIAIRRRLAAINARMRERA
mgnify:CR=1 FL=1